MSITSSPIPVVDLFAGPGGLGEGFSALDDGKAFQIAVSAERDPIAHQTLRLRAFYRLLRTYRPEALDDYYRFCNGESDVAYSDKTQLFWELAGKEALCLEIGSQKGNAELDNAIKRAVKTKEDNKPWVLIGGPPCQAYSLVGRSRNKGKANYKPEEDHRHFLYKEYLRIIQRNHPDIFVMENVKGILSSKIDGKLIFHQILQDLANPDKALGIHDSNSPQYRIVSLVNEQVFKDGDDPTIVDAKRYIIRAEDHGIPQARHRVILLGVREDHFRDELPKLQPSKTVSVRAAIGDLPTLRSQLSSRLSKEKDSAEKWENAVQKELWKLACHAKSGNSDEKALYEALKDTSLRINNSTEIGHTKLPKLQAMSSDNDNDNDNEWSQLKNWYHDSKLKVWLNHESRGHRIDDLARYGYAACFASVHKRSPKGHEEFALPGLAPAHKNWESGKFSDRFKVQLADSPSTTITSHISKDGHYFIHYDPIQCRSLTVREAARLQTFPDNYFFIGGRTQQYHQVGNAVPPLLANQIAEVVRKIIQPSI
ncbi:DNA (cytosine-5-)-methyltransferase [Zobellella taiwanensis]|uniref:DNA (cytosine-5-)-methyltransferase n=1 Tax=Zobellella taiwanensis TaxID=347535 RepID=A0A2P7R6X9_9GAMM|nr:DNA cytosine methyltransferase [Zobellella taiwanensis]PSJ45988.1 DNA (cytosine-5-)-methyltransferase [Zobellella taiwanensis]